MADEKRLPFRLLDEGLDAIKQVTGTLSAAALSTVRSAGRPLSERHADARPEEGSSSRDPSGSRGTASTDQEPDLLAEAAPAPSETATAPGALATALDDEASAALEKAAGDGGAVTDGLAIKDQGGRVPPEEEAGPKPFEPQVGP